MAEQRNKYSKNLLSKRFARPTFCNILIGNIKKWTEFQLHKIDLQTEEDKAIVELLCISFLHRSITIQKKTTISRNIVFFFHLHFSVHNSQSVRHFHYRVHSFMFVVGTWKPLDPVCTLSLNSLLSERRANKHITKIRI